MITHTSRIFVVLAALALVAIIAPTFAAEKVTPTSTFGADVAWNYGSYTVNRFTTVNESAYLQLDGVEKMREQGILAFSNKENTLFILREGVLRIEQTPFTLPFMYTCYGCYTSPAVSAFPAAYLVGDRIVVTMNDKWYLYDPAADIAELWFDPVALGMTNPYGYSAVAVNDQLYVYAIQPPEDGHTVYWVPQPNRPERIYETPEDVHWSRHLAIVEYDEAPTGTMSPSYFTATDDFVNGVRIGQIGEGVYVNNAGALTRIGYSRSLYGYVWIMDYTPYSAFAYGSSNAAWIGVDGNLYVATLDFDALEPTGIVDVPPRTPFRTVSDPAVFYDGVDPNPIAVYMNADAYFRDFDDLTFSKVVVIPDSAFDVVAGLETWNTID